MDIYVDSSVKGEIRQYERRIYDLEQLVEVSRALNSTLDYQHLIQAMLDICLAQAQTMQAGLFLLPDDQSDYVELAAEIRGFELEEGAKACRIALSSPLLQFLQEQPLALAIDEICLQGRDGEAQRLLQELGVELVAPMLVKRQLAGLIILGKKLTGERYTEMQRSFFADLASLSAIAVNNASLYERATVDRLTGLKNRAYFQASLQEQCRQAIENRAPLALMVSDIDHFKNVNDTYGHQAGDRILKGVAAILMNCSRNSDLASRYGGEEFCLAMPFTDRDRALKIGESFRQQIEAASLEYEANRIPVTISAGIAVLDPKIETAFEDKIDHSIFGQADRALYICKRSGRNQVKIYSPNMK